MFPEDSTGGTASDGCINLDFVDATELRAAVQRDVGGEEE
jgi:lipoprotein-anchoring transpeptidase ErfK/SrfK